MHVGEISATHRSKFCFPYDPTKVLQIFELCKRFVKIFHRKSEDIPIPMAVGIAMDCVTHGS